MLSIPWSAIVLAASVLPVIPSVRQRFAVWFGAQVMAYAIILIILLGVQQADAQNRRSSRGFAAAMARYVSETKMPVVVHALPEDLAVYLPLDLADAGESQYALLAV